jgi:hypothetical protein
MYANSCFHPEKKVLTASKIDWNGLYQEKRFQWPTLTGSLKVISAQINSQVAITLLSRSLYEFA